ncbi:transposase [Janthinobacterium sp. MDT1-19]|uniref:transposase n=1 Tax=Janthinobacterium sp. MDT1-19 TaxID=1259339 RepID=UPI003F24C71A
MPNGYTALKRAQKDVDPKWTKKLGKGHFSYKLYANIDKRHKLVRKVIITHGAVADTTVFEDLLDPSNTSPDLYADRGYPSTEQDATLTGAGGRVHIQRKGSATKPISQTQKQHNMRIATPRARVKHVFGAMRHMGGKLVRCMRIVRATFALNLKTASYNLQRLVYLKKRDLPAF